MENAKKFCINETKINQAHGYAFGEGNDVTKAATYTKSSNMCMASSSNPHVVHPQQLQQLEDETANLKLTSQMSASSSSAFDIKVKRKRACQMKLLVVLLALMSAACIACIAAFFYLRYQKESELHFNYTQNMVVERACNILTSFLKLIIIAIHFIELNRSII